MRIRPAHVNTCYLATLAIRILDLYDSSSNACLELDPNC